MKNLRRSPQTTSTWLHIFHSLSLANFSCFISYSLDGKDVDDFQHTDDDESESHQNSDHSKKDTKLARSVGKKRAPTPAIDLEDDDV